MYRQDIGILVIHFIADSHEECENCLETLSELENIDDDVERQKIKMAKTTDASFAEEVGVESYPALVFFKVSRITIKPNDDASILNVNQSAFLINLLRRVFLTCMRET